MSAIGDRKIQKTDAEWQAQLDPMQYQVARHAATERPFTGKFWDHWEAGRYNCVGCGRSEERRVGKECA